MSEAILVALITGGCAIAAQFIISFRSSKELFSKLEKQSELSDSEIKGEIAVIKAEISELRQAVSKHNGVIERTYHVEQQIAVHEEQIKSANRRLADMESMLNKQKL